MRNVQHWVVDASVALKWYLEDESNVSQAAYLWNAFAVGETTLVAPHYIRYEIANALEVARIQGRISQDQADDKLTSFLGTGVYLEADGDALLRAAIDATRRYEVTPYDALYLALAESLGFGFVTADRALYRHVRDEIAYIRWISSVGVDA
jgi:predicted nucleic acid-binding protein